MLDTQQRARIINNASGETGLGRDRSRSWRVTFGDRSRFEANRFAQDLRSSRL